MPLAVCCVNSAGALASSRANIFSRSNCTARLAAQDSPYCDKKPARLRTANKPMMATGTPHSGSLPLVKPWSSKWPSSCGISGSVMAVMAAPAAAAHRPRRLLRMYGKSRERRCKRVGMSM